MEGLAEIGKSVVGHVDAEPFEVVVVPQGFSDCVERGVIAGFLGSFADADTEEGISFSFLLLSFLHFGSFFLGVFAL